MIFYRILALVALLFAVGACAAGSNLPQTTAATASSRPGVGIPVLPATIERDVGAVYPDPALQDYVDRVGQKLVRGSGLPGPYRFVVLDLPLVNAHAVANYVFVTRGLLAVLDDEAELAAALGHELGHLTQRHAAQRARARQGVLEAAVEAAAVTGSVTVGRSVARDGLIALRRYSREQELEADRIGLGYVVQAGYRSTAMSSLIDRLRQQSRLEAQLLGEATDAFDQRSATATHPAPIERREALQAASVSAGGESGRPAYLAAIDGMSVDDPPGEGFVRGQEFLHPTLRLAFEAPRDFRLFNDQDGILGVGRDRSLLYFACSTDSVPGRLDEWMRNTLKPTPTDIQAIKIDGAEAAIGARPRGSDTGLGQARYVMVRHGDRICFFNLLSEGPDRDRRIEVLVNAARSFRTLSVSEAAALRPYRLRVVAEGASPAQLAARLPYSDLRMERLLVLNGVDTPAELARLPQVKVVEP
ncbi:M48 family metalloprotease [Reyranella sp.]|uniref:M48 family metalloprotease n=1 Tax=Reyranella sp. TaxID=1929291 RepID=UPI00272FC612|nr:M48 family metalloprotease [Reyranella sp.]MDP2377566.1 M48 family metalloprotease [Reyranella sp.]